MCQKSCPTFSSRHGSLSVPYIFSVASIEWSLSGHICGQALTLEILKIIPEYVDSITNNQTAYFLTINIGKSIIKTKKKITTIKSS